MYSTENNFISKILIQQSAKNLDIIKINNNKYYYIFNITNPFGVITLDITFNLNEKEYILINFEFEGDVAPGNIILNINEEDNNKIKEIGNKGTLEIITDYNDTETNIFDYLNIISYTFNNTMIDNNNNTYNAQCKLWKSNNGRIKIFCKFDDNLNDTTKNLIFSDINCPYKKHILNIKNHCKISIKKINAYIPFIYSDKQTINLDSEDILSFRFKYDLFSNEKLFLFDNKYKSAYFDKCSTYSYENEIICQISHKKLKSILSFSGEKFYLATSNMNKGQYIFEPVEDIIITSNINKKDQYVRINKLINEISEFYSFIYYETNITNIPDLTSNIFDINYNNSCMFKKRRAKNENLLLICYTNITENNFSLGQIDGKILNDINIENNFIIIPGYNNETNYMNGDGGMISSVYPEILNFTNVKSLYINIGFYGNLEGIKLNPNSSYDLKCEKYNNFFECLVPKSHFDNNKTGYYNIYYKNHLNIYSIKYEAPLIYVILSNETEPEPDQDDDTDDTTDEPSDDKTDEPSDDKTDEPTEETSEDTTEESSGEPTDETSDDTTEESSGEPTDEIIEETTDEATEETNDETTDKTSDNNNPNKNNDTSLMIIYICVPIGFIIIIIALFFIVRWIKRKKNERSVNNKSEMIPLTESMKI